VDCQDAPSKLVTAWGHTGATPGPRTTGPQRTTAVTIGPASAPLNEWTRPSAAGRRDLPRLPYTEDVAPTAAPPSRLANEAGDYRG
jgi:hypothetical protein